MEHIQHTGLENHQTHQALNAQHKVAEDSGLQITTALLWLRSAHGTSKTNGSSVSQYASETPEVCPVDPATSTTNADTEIHDHQPDLGLLQLHQDRLTAAAKALQWQQSAKQLKVVQDSIFHIREEIGKHLQNLAPVSPSSLESRKIRILIDRQGSIQIDSTVIELKSSLASSTPHLSMIASFVPPSFDRPSGSEEHKTESPPPCIVHLDTHPTTPSLYTTHKTTSRDMYSAARTRVNLTSTILPTAQEVLLYNTNGEVMETSACTIYFRRDDGTWITPSAECGPNLGVTRRLALERGLCTEDVVKIEELKAEEEVWLSNAVRGFFMGVLMLEG